MLTVAAVVVTRWIIRAVPSACPVIAMWREVVLVVSRIITPPRAVVAPPMIEETRAVMMQFAELVIGK